MRRASAATHSSTKFLRKSMGKARALAWLPTPSHRWDAQALAAAGLSRVRYLRPTANSAIVPMSGMNATHANTGV